MKAFPRLAADAGRIVGSRDIPAGKLKMALFQIPEQSRSSDARTLLLAASTATSGWKRQCIELHHAGRTQLVQTPPRKSVLGHATTRLDETEVGAGVEVVLHDSDHWLTSCSDDDLQVGENLAAIGNEVVQFGDATPLGTGRFRLGRLLRGRAGTDIAIHVRGEPFVLIQHGTLQPIGLHVWMSGSPVWAVTPNGSAQCTLTPTFKGLAPSGWRLTF
jgi:hypothetical protein